MVSNLLYTLFFEDGMTIEIYRSKFRGYPRPKVGDLFRVEQEEQENGKIEAHIYVNNKEIKGIPL